MDTTSLVIGIIAGALGTGYAVYGRKQRQPIPLVCGLGLIVAPYAIDPVWGQLTACGICAILPWIWKP